MSQRLGNQREYLTFFFLLWVAQGIISSWWRNYGGRTRMLASHIASGLREQEVGLGYRASGPPCSHPCPLVRLHPLKFLQPFETTALVGHQGLKHMSLWGKISHSNYKRPWQESLRLWESYGFCCSNNLLQVQRLASSSLTWELQMAHSSQSFQRATVLWEVKLFWLMTEASKWATNLRF